VDGLLLPSDLGAGGWVAGTSAGDRTTPTTVLVDGCVSDAAPLAPIDVPTTGVGRVYRGSTPEGAEWLLSETVGHLGSEGRADVAAQLRALARCPSSPPQVVLAATDDIFVFGVPMTSGPVGAIGYVKAVALRGDVLVSLETLPGGAVGGPALPGQTHWMLDTLRAAVVRATGAAPVLPPPNAAAVQAAAKYRQLDPGQVVHVESPAPDAGGAAGATAPDAAAAPSGTAPTGAASGDGPTTARSTVRSDPVLPGFLTVADLGPVGAWSAVAVGGDRTSDPGLILQLPACAGRTGRTVRGAGASQLYRGWLNGTGPDAVNGNEWIVNETRITLDPTSAGRAKQALAEAAACPTSALMTNLGRLTSSASVAWRIVALQDRPDGSSGYAQGWLLHGPTLVQVDTLPGGAHGGEALPGGSGWFSDVLVRAEDRMGT
jgi:hypothetical protein